MKNKFVVFPIYFLEILLIVGCSQVQPTMTATAIPKQTNTFLPIATPTPLPTFTPIPTLPTKSLPPFPKGFFEPFRESNYEIYEPTSQEANNEVIKSTYGVISSDSVIEEKILIDSSMGYTTLSLFWEKGDFDLILIQPDGKEINLSTPKYHISYSGVLQVGTWTMKIIGISTPAITSNYMIQVTSDPGTTLYRNIFAWDVYALDSPIKFSLGITDGVSGSLLTPLEYVHGISLNVTAETPDKKYYTFDLYDDGQHEDGQVDDGVYGNIFSNTEVAGKYNFFIEASGINNRAKEPFAREYYLSTIVK
jgi:hypothetical protein